MDLLKIMWTLVLFCMLPYQAGSEENQVEQSIMLGLRTVAYEVKDMDAAVEWYTKAFGIAPYFESPQYVGFSIRGFELGLMPETGLSAKGNNVLAYWGVDDVVGVYDRLIELGATANAPIIEAGGGIQLGSVKDPYGNVIGIVYNPTFKLD